jgi:PII-like signaling protein
MPPLPKRTMRGRFLIVGDTVDEEERIRSFLPFVREEVKNAIVICSDATSERVLPKERKG